MNNQAVPTGYTTIQDGSRTIIVRDELALQLRPLMTTDFEDLRAREDAQTIATGRAGPIRIPGPDGPILIRPYAHGGLLGTLGGVEFAHPGRAYEELAVAHHAASIDLPVSPLLGITARHGKNGRWRMEAWSAWIDGAMPLSLFLRKDASGGPAERHILTSVADALNRCHSAGLLHGDLNARNILVDSGNPKNPRDAASYASGQKIWIVDLDRTRMVSNLGSRARISQLQRLFRSLVKEKTVPHGQAGVDMLEYFARAYFGESVTNAELRRFLAGCRRSAIIHSLSWKLQDLVRGARRS